MRAAESLRVGADMDWEADMGPLISAEHLARVHAHVADAVAKGATVLTGGRALPQVGPDIRHAGNRSGRVESHLNLFNRNGLEL